MIGLDLAGGRAVGAEPDYRGVRRGAEWYCGSAGGVVCADRWARDARPEQEAGLGLPAAASEGQAHPDCGGNDSSALGAVDAVREQKREQHVAIVGQDCIAEAVTEMRKERSPLIGSVSHQTNSYGPSLIHLGLAAAAGADGATV